MGRGRGAAALGHTRVALLVATGASSNPATPERLPGTQLPVEETEAQIRAGGVGQSQVLSYHPCWESFLGPLPQEGWTQTGGESPSLPMHADGQRPVTRWAAQASPGPHPDLSPAWQAPVSREIMGCDVKGCLPGSVNAWWGGCMLFPVGCGLRAWVQVHPQPDSLVSLFYVFVCGCVRPQLHGHAGSRRAGFSLSRHAGSVAATRRLGCSAAGGTQLPKQASDRRADPQPPGPRGPSPLLPSVTFLPSGQYRLPVDSEGTSPLPLCHLSSPLRTGLQGCPLYQ